MTSLGSVAWELLKINSHFLNPSLHLAPAMENEKSLFVGMLYITRGNPNTNTFSIPYACATNLHFDRPTSAARQPEMAHREKLALERDYFIFFDDPCRLVV